jgi:hypothetical protein
MVIHPITLIFKIAVLLVVLYAGEPNSLRLIVASGLAEGSQMLFFALTSPFVDPWVDLLSKCGSVHQIAQLGLMCIFRAQTYVNPKNRSAAVGMILVGTAYLCVAFTVIAVTVIIPAAIAFIEARRRKAHEEEKAMASGNDVLDGAQPSHMLGTNELPGTVSETLEGSSNQHNDTAGDPSGTFRGDKSLYSRPSFARTSRGNAEKYVAVLRKNAQTM